MNKYHGTVKEFLAAGHRFVEGDVLLLGTLLSVDEFSIMWVNHPSKWERPDIAHVVYAACLNKEPEPEYELVHCGFTSVEQPIKELFDGGNLFDADGCHVYLNDTDNSLSICSDDSYISYDIVYRRVPLRTKTATYPMPETKAPEAGAMYFSTTSNGAVVRDRWSGSSLDFAALKAGNVFLKREHAQAKADAQAVEVEE
jgi:hypothetical protein